MFAIQYKVSTNLRNPNSNTGIRKPWTEKPNTMDCKTVYHNNAKNDTIYFLGAPPSNPQIHVVDNSFGANSPKTNRGALAGYPPVTPLRRARRKRIVLGASRARGQTPCKEYSINPTFSHLLFSLHVGRTNFLDQQSREEMPITALR